MRHRLLLSVLVFAVTAGLLFAEGATESSSTSGQPGQKQNIQITWLAHPVLWSVAGDLPAKFEQETGIKIVPALYGVDDVQQKAMIEIASKSGRYDIISLANNIYRNDLGRDVFVDLTDKIKELPDYQDLSQGFINLFAAADGSVVGVPYRSGLATLVYRSDLFEKFNLPSPQEYPYTIDEFLKAAKTLTFTGPDGPVYGFSFKGKAGQQLADDFETWLYAFGGRMLDDNGKVVINSPQAVEAAQFLHDLIYVYKVTPPGVLTYTSTEEVGLIEQGKSAQTASWWNYLPTYNDPTKSKVAGKMKIGYLPMKVGQGLGYGQGGGWGLFINRFSPKDRQDAAWQFISYITSKQNQIYEMERGNGPTRVSVFQTPEFAKIAGSLGANIVAKYTGAIKFPTSTAKWTQLREIAAQQLSLVLAGSKGAQDAMNDAKTQMDALLAQ